ncbi:MAG: hypothetical protein JG781_2604 [Peptococcaceae bacterium]|nr:hypothetical protein [Peptococcaceae bacterium]
MVEYLVVDGYNIINSWPELNRLKEESFEHARIKLIETLINYHGCTKIMIIVVFDAHQVKGGIERRESYYGVEVVYTREGETADMFIEKIVGSLSRKSKVFVATSDWIEQSLILQRGAFRLTSRELLQEIKNTLSQTMNQLEYTKKDITRLNHHLPDNIRETLEKWRRGQ